MGTGRGGLDHRCGHYHVRNPSALSSSDAFDGFFNQEVAKYTGGKSWFDSVDWLVSNVLLPFGGIGVALFLTWHVEAKARAAGFKEGTPFKRFYLLWLFLLRWLVPIAVILVFLNAVGVFPDPVAEENPQVEAVESGELQNPATAD